MFSKYLTFSVLCAIVLGGLEDAKHTVVLRASDFDATIREPSVGTLTAFFAPWCGHCKSLEPTWTKVAKAFESDSKCNVAILDADNAANKPIASRFGVTGFPTIKFLPSDGSPAIDYTSARSEDAFLEFLNKQCGSNRLPGGALSDLAGRLPSFDKLASQFLAASTTLRTDLFGQARLLAAGLNDTATSVYLKTFSKLLENEDYVKTESARLTKILEKKAGLANKKLEELQIKANILNAFSALQGGAKQVVDQAADAASQVSEAAVKATDRVKEEL